ncbi:MAG: hypothetical protein JNL57_12685 [Bacteroidetes bacterium]|nr:hypothetical protein [Bacteroidota bacterium]
MKLYQTLLSLAKVAIRSRWFLKNYKTTDSRVIVIGNGPSAKAMLENPPAIFATIPLIAVNMFAGEKYFTLLKPKYFLMADHAFYEFEEVHFRQPESHPRVAANPGYAQTQALVNQTWEALLKADWPITLFVPQIYMHTYPVQLAKKKNMTIVEWNYTVVKGFTWFENLLYKAGLGSPQCQNVINACIFQGINSGFNEIYLTGIDNNFHLNIEVQENNQVCVIDNHFYEVKKKVSPLMSADKQGNPVPVPLHAFFASLSKAFYSYQRLKQYAIYRGVRVYNATPGSFVDAFERKSLDSL